MEAVVTGRVVKIHKDYTSGDYVVPIPDDILEEMGWEVGDVLDIQYVDGLIEVKKSDE